MSAAKGYAVEGFFAFRIAGAKLFTQLPCAVQIDLDQVKQSTRPLEDPVAQGLLYHSQTACNCRLALARLNKARRLLLELKCVTSPFRLRHLRYPFALEQLAKGCVLRRQDRRLDEIAMIFNPPATNLVDNLRSAG
jgi:hypothetical protein